MLVSVIAALALALYLAPSLVAFLCGHPQKGRIALLNFLLGWTILGWFVAFVWACKQPPPPSSSELSVAKRLLVVEIEDLVRMKQRGQLTNAEYAKRRKMLIDKYGG